MQIPGSVIWAGLDPVEGREQAGRRPVLVASSIEYLRVVTSLVMVVPVTGVDRGWPNHVLLEGPTGLACRCWAMTEQPRTLSRDRIVRVGGTASADCLLRVRSWLADFLDLPAP